MSRNPIYGYCRSDSPQEDEILDCPECAEEGTVLDMDGERVLCPVCKGSRSVFASSLPKRLDDDGEPEWCR